jgi:hypothetical protein
VRSGKRGPCHASGYSLRRTPSLGEPDRISITLDSQFSQQNVTQASS